MAVQTRSQEVSVGRNECAVRREQTEKP